MNNLKKLLTGLIVSFAAVFLFVFVPQSAHADQMSLSDIRTSFLQDVLNFLNTTPLTADQSAAVMETISPLMQYPLAVVTSTTVKAITAPTITSISPTSGIISTSTPITIKGTNFTLNNVILFNGRVAANKIASADGKTLTFFIPSSTAPACNLFTSKITACPANSVAVTPGIYSVTVENANGTSKAISFSVTVPPVVVSLTASLDKDTPAPSNFIADGAILTRAPILIFDLAAKGQAVTLNTMTITLTATGSPSNLAGKAAITNVILYDSSGKKISSSVSVKSGVASFTGIGYAISTSTPKSFIVAVNVGSIGVATSSFRVTKLTYAGTAGKVAAQAPVNGIKSSVLTFRSAGPQFTLVGSPAIVKSTVKLSTTFTVTATAIGTTTFAAASSSNPSFGTSTRYVLVYKDGVADLSSATNSQYHISVTYAKPASVTLSSNGKAYILANKASTNFVVTYSMPLTGLPSGHTYSFQLAGITWATFNGSAPVTTSKTVALSSPLGYLADDSYIAGDGSVAGSSPGYTAVQSGDSSLSGDYYSVNGTLVANSGMLSLGAPSLRPLDTGGDVVGVSPSVSSSDSSAASTSGGGDTSSSDSDGTSADTGDTGGGNLDSELGGSGSYSSNGDTSGPANGDSELGGGGSYDSGDGGSYGDSGASDGIDGGDTDAGGGDPLNIDPLEKLNTERIS